MADDGVPVDLVDDGLLWLINRTTFHPRGYALAATVVNGKVTGFQLLGDGSEPWSFAEGADEGKFEAAEAALRRARSA